MINRVLGGMIAASLTLGLIAPPALAQFRDFQEELPEHLLRPSRTLSGDSIAFCVDMTSMMTEFHLELAGELADALLLNHTIVEVRPVTPSLPYDFRIPLIEGEIYLFLAHHCDAFLGFTQASSYESWLRATPPYLTTYTVLAVREGEYPGGYASLTPATELGTRLGSLADSYLTAYNRTLPQTSQVHRVVYPNNEVLIQRLLDDTLDAILIWEPGVLSYRAANPGAPAVDTFRQLPFTVPPTEFVIGIRGNEDFLQLSLTQAVLDLQRDGTVNRLAVEHGILPAPAQ